MLLYIRIIALEYFHGEKRILFEFNGNFNYCIVCLFYWWYFLMRKKKKIAILVDLEFSKKSGGHVKFWQRIADSLKTRKLNYDITLFFLGNKSNKIQFSDNIQFNITRPLISSKILRKIGVDADSTDLSPINFKLLWSLKKFDLLHTTDQLFSMSKTAKMASKIWNIPLTTSYHTDTPSYTEYYVLEVLKKLPLIFQKLLIHKFKLHKFVSNNQKEKNIKVH